MFEESIKTTTIGDIYRTIYYNGPCSRQNIADYLGLSLPTVTLNLSQLMESNLIYNAGSFESTGGRKPYSYSCVPDARYSIGIDITKNHLSIVIIDLNNRILASRRLRITFEDSDSYFQFASDQAEELIDISNISRSRILGCGISLPVIVNKDQKSISYATVIDVSDQLYEHIQKHCIFPFLLFNDANSGGLAEAWHSTSNKNEVYLSLSSSVGGAVINALNISIGSNCRASEFGHITLFPNGRKCYCGKRGCVNAYCSAQVLANFTDGNIQTFFDELDHNIGFQNCFDEYLDHLALTVNSLRMCYDCDVILGGSVGAYMDDYLDLLKEKASVLNPFEDNANYIKTCRYKTEAAAAGAALYFVKQFISNM